MKYSNRNDTVERFDLKDTDQFLLPNGGSRHICTVTDKSKLLKLYKEWKSSEEVLKKIQSTIRTDIFSLINQAKTYEEVVEIWSGAEAVKDQVCEEQMAISILSEETINRIKTY